MRSGDVKFVVNGNEVGNAGEGMTFGELSLLFNTPRAATVAPFGLKPVELYRIDRHTFRTVLSSNFGTLDNINVYSERVDLKRRLEELTILGISDGDDDGEENGEDAMRKLAFHGEG